MFSERLERMTVPAYGGCVWPIDSACFTDQWESYSTEVQDRAIALASSTLHRLTGRRVGGCPITVRPCSPGQGYLYGFPRYLAPFAPTNWNGTWINSCPCTGLCGCTVVCEVRLPAPVGRLDQVKVDGSIIELDSFRIDNGNLLVWQGSGTCPLPAKQDLHLPDTEVGTFSVTYLNAYPVDSLGSYAAGVLAMEYGKACTGGKCRLPSGVTTIARQGITMEVSSGAFPDGMTGIREVDSYIALWNPQGLARGSAVYSPDIPRHRIRTGGPYS